MRFNFKKFGEAVKFKRTAGITGHDKPYTLKTLGEYLKIDYSALSRLENGKGVNVEYVLMLSRWLGCDIWDFMEEN